MNKRNMWIVTIVSTLAIATMGFLLLKKDNSHTLSSIQNNKNLNEVQKETNVQEEFVSKDQETPFNKEEENLLAKLSDLNVKAEKRISYILNLNLNDNESKNINILIQFITSENPYDENVDPHSSDALAFQKEASLRIFAIRKLAENLSIEKFSEAVSTIEEKSENDSLRRIAKQALVSKSQGRNYFVDTLKAIEELPQP